MLACKSFCKTGDGNNTSNCNEFGKLYLETVKDSILLKYCHENFTFKLIFNMDYYFIHFIRFYVTFDLFFSKLTGF